VCAELAEQNQAEISIYNHIQVLRWLKSADEMSDLKEQLPQMKCGASMRILLPRALHHPVTHGKSRMWGISGHHLIVYPAPDKTSFLR
jgi:hypothetical protein